MIDVLAEWEQPTVQRVWLSAPNPAVSAAVAYHWRKGSPSALVPFDMEPHVAEAMTAAQITAGDTDVTPSHVLRVIIGLPQLQSPAFEQLRRLADLRVKDELESFWPRIKSEGIQQPLNLAAGLEKQLTYAQQSRGPADGRHRIWGRDLVTAVLFASDRGYLAGRNRCPDRAPRDARGAAAGTVRSAREGDAQRSGRAVDDTAYDQAAGQRLSVDQGDPPGRRRHRCCAVFMNEGPPSSRLNGSSCSGMPRPWA